jgi:hypothetical protein
MPRKVTLRNNRRKTRNNRRKTRNNRRKTRNNRRKLKTRIFKKGGADYDKVNCCMCGKEVDKSKTLVPQICLQKYGSKAHRICSDCWWNNETGFARENAPHGCPGCAKNLPLTINNQEMVDLTLDDD